MTFMLSIATSSETAWFMREPDVGVGRRYDGTRFPVEAIITNVTSSGKPTLATHIGEQVSVSACAMQLTRSDAHVILCTAS